MKLFSILLLISGTCFAATRAQVLPTIATECAARKDLKGTKINCPQETAPIQSLIPSKPESELELALIEEEMGPPPAPVSEDEELRLE